MIEITKTEVFGFKHAIRGMRNPMNSWDKMDSLFGVYDKNLCSIGENDLKLMKKLANAGTDHGKFLRMITVYCDINAPLYWWKEYDTYKVGTVANSCSTMHKIQEKEFTLDDFSHEHLERLYVDDGDKECPNYDFKSCLNITIANLNTARQMFLKTKDKKYWWQMIQLLPTSYNQKRTCELNYAVLKNIYHSRKGHKLDEWRDVLSWIESLPYSELITQSNLTNVTEGEK